RRLLVGGLAEGRGADAASVHPRQERIDRLALARALDAADEDREREVGAGELPLRLEQPLAHLGRFAVVGLLLDAAADFGGLEHVSSRLAAGAQVTIDRSPALAARAAVTRYPRTTGRKLRPTSR